MKGSSTTEAEVRRELLALALRNAARSATAPHMFGPWTPGPNPCVGVNPHNGHGSELTFGGQSTHLQPMPGAKDKWIALFDLWTPENPIDGGYIWLRARGERWLR